MGELSGQNIVLEKSPRIYRARAILGFDLNDDGCFFDPFRDEIVFNPAKAPKPILIPFHYSAVPEMYLLLSKYAEASEVTLTGTPITAGKLDCLMRFKLEEEECRHLLQ